MTRGSAIAAPLLVWGFLATAPAQALLINGSFEFPDLEPTGIATFFPGAVQEGFGWTVNSGNVEVAGELYPPLPGPSFDGGQHLDLNGVAVGSISQAFETTPGVEYQLSFAYASNYFHRGELNPATAIISITDVLSLTGLVTPFSISHGSSTASDLDWVVHQVAFTAIDATTSIRFDSDTLDTPLGGILLDGIVVVPEPSTGLLCALGLGVFSLRRRRSA